MYLTQYWDPIESLSRRPSRDTASARAHRRPLWGAGHWVHSVGVSIATPGNQNGSWHPNYSGQAAIAAIIYNDILRGL